MKNHPTSENDYHDNDDQVLFEKRKFGIGFRPINKKGITASLSFGIILIIVVNAFSVIPALTICLALTVLFYAWARGKML